ncbi:MAG TPA: hypothetical protein VFQ53_34095 [Kofleriaceae bacterium]|nr:hypothetical protein [Kofleriaceae bacterium]
MAGAAEAQPKPATPAVVGATELVRLAPPVGFIDDGIAADGDRVAYVVADSTAKAELHVVSLAGKPEQVVDVSAVTLHPIALELVGGRALVIGAEEDGRQVAALVELADGGRGKPAGRAVYKVGPATHVTRLMRDGKLRLAVHRVTTTGDRTRHEVELLALDTGRRIAGGRAFELEGGTTNKALDLRVNHWSDGFTVAHGIKGGEWNKKDNARSPDVEATYDLVAGKLVDRKPIEDLFEQRKRFQTLADAGDGRLDFVRALPTGVQLWHAGKSRMLELDQPYASYDAKSLQGTVAADGTGWIALQIDPVNAEAVARQKADVEYLDVFRVTADGKAVRKARVLASSMRFRFGPATGDRFWLLERNQTMERGGKALRLFQIAP